MPSSAFTRLILFVFLFAAVPARGQQAPALPTAPAAEVAARPTTRPPVLDGVLDDEAWSQPPLSLGAWLSYNPLYGDRLSQTTDVWLAYDEHSIYVAFRCTDPEPGKIKTGVRRRDALFSDDWVGLSIDSLGTRQTSYDMFVNPSGMQADILTGAGSGENVAPDWVWEAAGRQTPTGYEVELRLPLESIRFSGGDQVKMGILFWRRVSRLGVSVAWPDLPPGKSVFQRHATLAFSRLAPRPTRELIPSATYAVSQVRDTPTSFGSADSSPDAGISAKVGLTSAVTIDATINPDFSQVESDAFQVEVNQRFPVFYSEKRPFFMEGSDLFALAGSGGDASLQAAVHTRRIVDPAVGVKLTGSVGALTVGTISAWDDAPGRAGDDGVANPFEGRRKAFTVGRATYSLGGGSYVGAIVTDARFAGGGNRAGGADLSLRLPHGQSVAAAVLYTASTPAGGGRQVQGAGGHAQYNYSSRRTNIQFFGEHYDTGFAMDTAFVNQTGVTRGWVYADLSLYPDKKRYPWLRRITPFLYSEHGRDRVARGEMHLTIPGVRVNFTRQGFLRIDRFFGSEPWNGQSFDMDRWRVLGEVQLLRWLNLEGRVITGLATYYDPVSPFQGRSRQASFGLAFEPVPQLSEQLSVTLVDFDREATGERVYSVRIVNSRTTYQFTKYFALRGIVQFDSQRKRVLTDFLSSFELRPGTVLYAGYGSLVERRAYRDGQWVPLEGPYLTTRRGLFFKASYLYRF